MMRKFCLALAIAAVGLMVSCTKKTKEEPCVDLTVTADASDSAALANYITSKGIEATYDSRGFYYRISKAGDASRPGFCGKVVVNYAGKLANGQQFDSGNNASFTVSNLVSGFRYGLNLIGAGGKVTIYLPPSLGYGNDDYGTIAGGSILIFDVDLISITN